MSSSCLRERQLNRKQALALTHPSVGLGDEAEVITTAEFHPSSCSLLAYGSSSGLVRLVDLRRSALCDHSVRM